MPDQQSPQPGSTPAAVVSLLVHRVLGPLRRDRVRMVLDYHGLAGRPAWQEHYGPVINTDNRSGTGKYGR